MNTNLNFEHNKLLEDYYITLPLIEEEEEETPKELFQQKMKEYRETTQRLQKIKNGEKTNRKELREIATKRGIKGSWNFNLKTLCEKLKIPLWKNEVYDKHHRDIIKKPVKIILTSVDNETLTFYSIYKTAKILGKNPGFIPYCIKHKKEVEFEGKNWVVSR